MINNYVYNKVKDWTVFVSKNGNTQVLFSKKAGLVLADGGHLFESKKEMLELFGYRKVTKL